MDRLPEEIVDNIISHLAAGSRDGIHENNWVDSDGSWIDNDPAWAALAPYATVSRRWQEPVEARTFARIILTPERLASPLAAQALTPDRVRRFVRSVQVHVVLPTYDEEARGRREDDADRAANDAAFTEVVRNVFALLSSVDTATDGYRPKIRLSMAARCVSDTKDWEARKWEYNVGHEPNDIFEARYKSSYLDLERSIQDGTDALPELRCISEFQVRSIAGPAPHYRHFAPRVVCLMASKMSCLETVDWDLKDDMDHDRRDVERRKKLRADFADSLQTLPSTLRWFRLGYWCHEPTDQYFECPSILEDVANQSNSDKLSVALHKLSQQLAYFDLIAEVGPEVLWPSGSTDRNKGKHQGQQKEEDDEDGAFSPPLWPSMLRCSVCPGAIAPSGKWLFRRRAVASDSDHSDNGTDGTDSDRGEREHYFRDEPDPEHVSPLFMAAARAAGRMPALLSLDFRLNSPMNMGGVAVTYTVPRGGRPTFEGTPPGMAELFVESEPPFQQGEEVMQAWREAARGHTGTESGLAVVIKEFPWL
ncbi:hypothetical protein C8A01DRAFT_18560 [Parachaetomium inaequale]|uniref:F-box domain-containing protein n=1 Tax=Parachaetomium inaequale TaxID=2588326 RepID=A0AAN6PAB4_9PEZI|nr:hypothetical protein C8A01DRAFT_18560 [Parachaetomium inaequale]